MYLFTGTQLATLLEETIKLFEENCDVHGLERDYAISQTVLGTIEGLEQEAILYWGGECKCLSQMLTGEAQ